VTAGGAKIAWLVPSLIEGSGGHRTIVQNVNALIDRGHACDIYLEPTAGANDSEATAARRLREYFGDTAATVRLGFDVQGHYDLVFATAWYTAKFVNDSALRCPKAYFVQDFEAYFNAMGDGYLLAVNSYRYGLSPVTIGRWLTDKLTREFGTPARYFDFCADLGVYRPLAQPARERAVCFICQPEKPRRCTRLGLEALGILKHWQPDVQLYLYGSRTPANAWFEHQDLGLLSVPDCNRLYNRCAAGLCLSSTNPSRVPFEMMAAGLPVVDLYGPNNLFDMPDSGVLLADSRPESLARALLTLLNDQQRRTQMSQSAAEFMADRDLAAGFRQFTEATEALLRGDVAGAGAPPQLYRRPCFDLTSGPLSDVDGGLRAVATEQAAEAAALATRLAEQVRAMEELDGILNSRSWGLVQRLKSTWPYRWLARRRWGPDHLRSDTGSDPRERLARLKASRAYRTIQRLKQMRLCRWYARRKYGPAAG
jgi:glycosyltransferase involved in cell wall biosynthesis